MKLKIDLLFFILSTAACSTSPLTKDQAKQVKEDKQILYRQRNSNQDSEIIVMRDSGFYGSACDTDVLINNKTIGQVGPGEYIQAFLPAGEYILGARPRGICPGTLLEVEANLKQSQKRTFRIGITTGGDMKLMPSAY